MKLFTVGPTQMFSSTKEVASHQIPYFRNNSFSQIVLENERLLCRFADCRNGRTVFLTSSGTGAMEATVMNCLSVDDRALVINGGSFGARFLQLCRMHNISAESIDLQPEEELTEEHLRPFENKKITALLVNLDETSTAQLYNINMLANFCRRHDAYFIVDAISSFGADYISMEEHGIDALILSSQKALSLAPGLSFVILSKRIIEKRVNKIDPNSLYFDFKMHLKDGERGQTPFTPAVGVMFELNDRLKRIEKAGGIASEINRVKLLANDFRKRLVGLPVSIPSYNQSNALTRIIFEKPIAKMVENRLIASFDLVPNPCGGVLADYCIRVAHIGDLAIEDNQQFAEALKQILQDI